MTVKLMETYISILRGINVSGQKMIKMEALRTMYEELEFKNVKTYLQSGNVIWQGSKANHSELEKRIVAQIAKRFGFDVPVIVKNTDELNLILANNPFINDRKEDTKNLYVTFLATMPTQLYIDKIKEIAYGADEYIVMGNVIYLFCPGGYGNTRFSNNFFESKLKVTATTRNLKTVNELVSLAESIAQK